VKKKISDILWISGGQIFGLLSNFLLLKLLTNNLGISEYGYFTLFMAVLLFVRQATYDPFSIIAAKEAVTKNFLISGRYCSLQVTRYATDRLFICLLSFVATLPLLEQVAHVNKNVALYIAAGVIYLGANGAQGIYLNILNAIGVRKWASIGIMLDSFVKLSLVSVVFTISNNGIAATIIAVAFSSFLVFVGVRYISKKFSSSLLMESNEIFASVKSLFFLSLPLFFPALLTALKGVSDKVFMVLFIGVEELAAYNVLLQIGFIPMMLTIGVIQTYITQNIYKLTAVKCIHQKEVVIYIGKICLYILLFMCIVVGMSLIFSDLVFGILVGDEYLKYAKHMPYFILAGTLSGIAGLMNIGVIGAFQTKIASFLMFFAILFGLIIFSISIAIYGFEGGVAGLIFSNLIMIIFFGSALLRLYFKK
jgi:O-antigen/teichoic acid export membrane protein